MRDLLYLMTEVNDIERNLLYIAKNANYTDKAQEVAVQHMEDLRKALQTCYFVVGKVLERQIAACKQ